MEERGTRRWLQPVLWGVVAVTIAVWSALPAYKAGWDLDVYKNAVIAVRAGQDPYVAGMNVQRAFHATLAQHPDAPPPYTYVYSPITLPLVHAAAHLPFLLTGIVYWTIFFSCVALLLWELWQFFDGEERRVFGYLLPAAVFFPGLLEQDVLFSGNVAYILYGLTVAAAMRGWRKSSWALFYVVVLVASCFKAPMLSLLAIPVLSSRRQWLPALGSGVVGVALFAMQPFVFGETFHHYLQAVELQFSYNRDFSSSPAGLFADALFDRVPYQVSSAIMYGLCAVVFIGSLFVLSRRYLDGRIALREWAPMLLLGTILLNPRIMEYDIAPITLPVLLLLWRFIRAFCSGKRALIACFVVFALLNLLAPWRWRTIACCELVLLFFASAWRLYWISSGQTGLAPEEERTPEQRLSAPVQVAFVQ